MNAARRAYRLWGASQLLAPAGRAAATAAAAALQFLTQRLSENKCPCESLLIIFAAGWGGPHHGRANGGAAAAVTAVPSQNWS